MNQHRHPTHGIYSGPSLLYKYIKINEYAQNLLENGKIFFPFFQNLNDPCEGMFNVSINTLQECEIYLSKASILASTTYNEMQVDKLYQKIIQNKLSIKDKIDILQERYGDLGIFCCSRNWSNPTMHSFYGDGHRGICLGLNVYEANLVSLQACSINYQLEKPRYNLLSLEPNDYSIFCTKHSQYDLEEEVRFFGDYQPLIEDRKGEVVITKGYCLSIPLSAIKEIVFGMRVDEDNKRNVKKWARGLSQATFWDAEIDNISHEYRLVRTPS